MVKEFLKLDNVLKVKLRIRPMSPLLIKLGQAEDTNKSDSFIFWNTSLWDAKDKNKKVTSEQGEIKDDDRKGELYIPGSSLKGLFRNHYYKISKLLEINVEDEFGEKLEEIKNKTDYTDDIYEKSPEISKLFGSKVLKSRFFAEDSYLENRPSMEWALLRKKFIQHRSITPIDRFTGGAIVPLKLEYTKENFLSEIIINNATVDDIKFLLFTIRDSQNSEIRIGNSKTRGFGEIEFEIKDLEITGYKGKNSWLQNLENFFDKKGDLQIGEDYLSHIYTLKEEYKTINPENNFIKEIFALPKGD